MAVQDDGETDKRVLEWAREICVRKGLDPERDAEDVIDLAAQDEDDWEECCDGGCTPCIAVVQSAAIALRRRLARVATPGDTEEA